MLAASHRSASNNVYSRWLKEKTHIDLSSAFYALLIWFAFTYGAVGDAGFLETSEYFNTKNSLTRYLWRKRVFCHQTLVADEELNSQISTNERQQPARRENLSLFLPLYLVSKSDNFSFPSFLFLPSQCLFETESHDLKARRKIVWQERKANDTLSI